MQVVIFSNSLSQTQELGKKIGARLEAGTVIRLIGDLGSGKTSMVQGIAQGLDVSPEYYITSPTFTLINEYPGRHTFYHVDLYRLGDTVDFEDIGLLDILFDEGVVAIEWAEKLTEELKNPITIKLSIIDDHSRKIHIVSFEPKIVDFLKKLEN
ncbi:MAG: tRNA (adenosine(37)-N6)-threonylcarbamoyltransferase complex ATPase subunit type 1 TsaE [Desulfobacterales bacterium]|jgi:tRNA threonylcarbamoyladenosine biosynthesis protein TsaE|nr:tRNA (adenosine(37)-N6)-threonylcarbamoyltransferase complex ATPase subunit type 1 TsaE [Desulfobacterales bacterium]